MTEEIDRYRELAAEKEAAAKEAQAFCDNMNFVASRMEKNATGEVEVDVTKTPGLGEIRVTLKAIYEEANSVPMDLMDERDWYKASCARKNGVGHRLRFKARCEL